MSRCECCHERATHTCAIDGQPPLGFCVVHFIEHIRDAHPAAITGITKATYDQASDLLVELRGKR